MSVAASQRFSRAALPGVRRVRRRPARPGTPTLTMNTYAHVLPSQDAEAAAKLEAALNGGLTEYRLG